jgi:hypothetical protein
MLQLRPNCELCDMDLPPDSDQAMICSYECTFCRTCVEATLHNVCPNCGGGFVPRPIRPQNAHRPNTGLQHQPASTKRVNTKRSMDEISRFCTNLRYTKPADR